MTDLGPARDDWLGYPRRLPRRRVGVALVLFAATFALHTPAITAVVGPLGIPTGLRVDVGVFFPLVFLPAAIAGYLDEGLVTALLLAAAVAFGGYLPAALFDYPQFPVPLGPVLRTALLVTILAGGVGFLVGAGIRRLVGSD